MTPLKARIFDVVNRAGTSGILHEELTAIIGLRKGCIKAHVHQINEIIKHSGYRISGQGGNWWMRQTHRRAA